LTSCNEFSPVGIHFQIPGAYVSMPYSSLSFVLREMKIAGIRKFVFDLHDTPGTLFLMSILFSSLVNLLHSFVVHLHFRLTVLC